MNFAAYSRYTPARRNSSNSSGSMWLSPRIRAMIFSASDSVLPGLYGRSAAVSASKMSAIAIILATGLSRLRSSRRG